MRLTGSQIVAEVLLDHGVDTVFGYPGGTALNIFDELYKYSDKIHHYLTAHEQGAAHAADGYARSTGKTGVVFATSGPGATNLVTGIATAFMDSIPLVAITANVPDSLFPTYTEWLEAAKEGTKNRTDCEELRPYPEIAGSMLKDLCQTYSRNVLLHGDLHHENILKNENGGYTVIDPKGVIGDPVFDLSRFILDEFRDNLVSEPKENILAFVKNLGNSVDIPFETLLRCLYIETVIWLFREELAAGESLEECASLITNMKTAYALVCDTLA